jgi:1-acyl-sn-glycerol-3-phosphate acyltransferase
MKKRGRAGALGRDPFAAAAEQGPPASGPKPQVRAASDFRKRVRREILRAQTGGDVLEPEETRTPEPLPRGGEIPPPPERAGETDEFGLDPSSEARWQRFFDLLYRHYWRVEAEGIEKIPASGGTLLIVNHAGVVPYDAAMLKTAVLRQHPARRRVRPLVPDFGFHLPFFGALATRVGGVRACPENALRLLAHGELVAVFPEGLKGLGKLYRERYRLQRFGRGGFAKLALRTGAPLVPVAIVGSEEIHPMLARISWVSEKLGIPYVPITPTFPLLGPLGAIPLPSKWKIRVGDPILPGAGPAAAEDPHQVGQLVERVRGTIQHLLRELVRERRTVFR